MRTRYAAGLAFAYLLSAAEVVAIAVSLVGRAVLIEQNLITATVLIIAGAAISVVGGVMNLERSLRWLESGR